MPTMIARSEISLLGKTDSEIAWKQFAGLSPYQPTLDAMENEVALISQGRATEAVWLLEHPSLYTSGTSAKPTDLIDPTRFPVFETGRGGQYTYHGPGQLVAYVMLNLAARGGDVRGFVATLEQWLINTLAEYGVAGERREDRVGIWVRHDGDESKIAAIGIRVRRGVTFHGVSLNVAPDLSHFDGIVPCGVSAHGVTSLEKMGIAASMADVDIALARNFEKLYGPLVAS